jgi:PAS domain S-box-containing protein
MENRNKSRDEHRYRQIMSDLESFFEHSGNGICCIDANGIVTRVNPGQLAMCGYAQSDYVGRHIAEFFESPELVAEILRCVTAGESIDKRRAEMRCRIGSLKNVEISANGLWDDGELVHIRFFTSEVSEQTQIQDALRLSEQRFRDAVDNFPDVFVIYDRERRFEYVNKAGLRKNAFKPEQLIGKRDEEVFRPEITETYLPTLQRVYQTGDAQSVEATLTTLGQTYVLLINYLPQVDRNGVVYQVLGLTRDITEARQTARVLRASEARLQLALEVGGMGAWQWNIKTNETIWWPGMEAVHGLPPGTVPISIGDYAHYIHPDDRDHVVDVVKEAIAEKKEHRVEYRVVWPDGSIHWIEGRGKLFFDGAGNLLLMAGICVDITRRKRIEQDLRFLAQASAELAGLVDHQTTLDRIAHLAVPSFADWCAVDVLDESGLLQRVAVAHVEPDKVQLAHEIHRRYPPDPNASGGIWNVLRTGQAEHVAEITDEMLEYSIRDQQYLAILRELGLKSYIGAPLTTRGKTLGVVTFITAESQRRYGPEDLALAEDLARRAAIAIENSNFYRVLQEADHRKDVFLATLAHELRNPLAPIVNTLNIMSLAGGDSATVGRTIRIMKRQVGHLTRLVDDLMDISRISTGKIELRKMRTNLVEILESALETSRPHIEAAGHELVITLPSEPTDLSADPVRLAQVFANLLNNAAKYTNPGGRIEVLAECTPSEFTIRIKDSGIGISDKMLKNIFTVFTQVSHPFERSQGGLGIGLSLVDGLVKLHGGTVEAYSEGLERGSEFVVHLPKTAEQAMQESTAGASPSHKTLGRSGLRRIVVVDDNVDGANSVADILRMLGNEVTVVYDGLAAVQAAADLKPDVVLLDIGLPGIDGYEAARRIRAQETAVDPVILIALTGWGQDQDKQRAREAGFNHHWVKPVGLDKLKEISA